MLLVSCKKNKDLHNLDLDTKGTVWKYIQWDLEGCFSGVHPNTDTLGNAWPPCSEDGILQGTPLAYGYFAVPWVAKRLPGMCVQWKPNEWRVAHPNVHRIFHHAHDTIVLAV